jgi:tripartite-type tricarboxylate transporter receptor subunit TctC
MLTRSMLLGMTVLGGLLAATATAGAAEELKWVDGKLQPLSDGFPNEPLSILVIDDPGTTDSIFVTSVVKATEGLSPVPIKIDHRPDFSTYSSWEAQSWLVKQGQPADDGYMMILYTAPGNIADVIVNDLKTEIGIDMTDINYVNQMEQLPYMLHQRADVPWGDTLDDMLKYAKENPNTIRYISGGPGAGQDGAMQWYMANLGFTTKEIIGGNSNERALAVASGDGDITVSAPDSIIPHFEGGKVEVLMIAGEPPAPAPWENVPTSSERGLKDDPWGTMRGFQVTNAVPEDHRLWLEELFRKASENEEFLASRTKIPGARHKYLGGAETKEYAQRAYDAAEPILAKQGVSWKANAAKPK